MQFILLMIITYFGLLIGSLISSFTKEELKPGKKYFRILKTLTFSVIFFYFLDYLNLHILISIFLTIIMFLLSFNFVKKQPLNNIFFYSFFSIVLFETYNFNPIVSLMIFSFGLIAASLEYDFDYSLFQNIKLALTKNILYPILCILLYFVF